MEPLAMLHGAPFLLMLAPGDEFYFMVSEPCCVSYLYQLSQGWVRRPDCKSGICKTLKALLPALSLAIYGCHPVWRENGVVRGELPGRMIRGTIPVDVPALDLSFLENLQVHVGKEDRWQQRDIM
ncbi:hypothetical protein SO802_011189 [Lithocarpus litseifolius]|uniref:Uncharacterized protein n=1 Tax=Lithocarpus litseifolius TaxID=425828 RepID=A0AAW2D1I5_9ROSI